jgi:phosphoglycolate phosphatase
VSVSFRHVVFDLDGTLIDSRQDLADAANALLARHGAPPLPVPDVVRMVGEGARTLVARVLDRAALQVDLDAALATFLEAYDARLANHTRAYDGIRAALTALTAAGCRLSVLTNKPQRATDRVLEALDLRTPFTAVLGGDTAVGRKPEPLGLRMLMSEAGTAPDETVMVGDSWVDVHTARAAGIEACLVTWGFGYEGVDAATRETVRWLIHAPADLMTLADAHPPAPSTPPAIPA